MRTYDEQIELRRYLWAQYSAICSTEELRVYNANIGRMKAASAPQQDKMLRKMFGDWDDPFIANELGAGFDSFSDRVLRRIGQESPDLFYINRCEICDRIVATPKACVCGWCGHEWFARRDDQNQIAEVAHRRLEQGQREIDAALEDQQQPAR